MSPNENIMKRKPSAHSLQNSPDLIPLNYGQLRILNQEMCFKNSSYNLPRGFILSGQLNIEIFKKSFDEVIQTQPFMKSRIILKDGMYFFKPLDQTFWQIEIVVASPPIDPYELLMKRFKQEEQIFFDIYAFPLFRVSLFALGKEKWGLILNFHHIIFDMESWKILFNELANRYNDKLNFHKIDLIKKMQKIQLFEPNKKTIDRNIDYTYWEKCLQDLKPLHWKHQNQSLPEWSFQGNELRIQIYASDVQKLKIVSRKMKCTLSMLLFSFFARTLFEYVYAKTIFIGMQLTARADEFSQKIVGFFLNSLVVRIDSNENTDLISFIRKSKENILEAYDKHHPDLDKLLFEKSDVASCLLCPIPQFNFDYYEQSDIIDIELKGIKSSRLYTDTLTAKRDLNLSVRVNKFSEKIDLRFEYSKNILHMDLAKRISESYLKKIKELEYITIN